MFTQDTLEPKKYEIHPYRLSHSIHLARSLTILDHFGSSGKITVPFIFLVELQVPVLRGWLEKHSICFSHTVRQTPNNLSLDQWLTKKGNNAGVSLRNWSS